MPPYLQVLRGLVIGIVLMSIPQLLCHVLVGKPEMPPCNCG